MCRNVRFPFRRFLRQSGRVGGCRAIPLASWPAAQRAEGRLATGRQSDLAFTPTVMGFGSGGR